MATFTLTASDLPAAVTDVNVVFEVEGDFIASTETLLTKTGTILTTVNPATNAPTIEVTFATKADDPDTTDSGSGYSNSC